MSARKAWKMEQKQSDFYQALRGRVTTWLTEQGEGYRHARFLLLAPDLFHLLCRLSLDKRVPAAQKAKLAVAIAYFVSPFDIIPEIILGPIALLDDIAIAAFALNSLINAGQGEIARELWAGEGDLLTVIQNVIAKVDDLLGGAIQRRLRGLLE